MLNKNFGRPKREPSVRSVRTERAVDAVRYYSEHPSEASLDIVRERINQLSYLDQQPRLYFEEADDTD